jgi:adenylate cyclase
MGGAISGAEAARMDEQLVAELTRWICSAEARRLIDPATFTTECLRRVVEGGIPLARASTSLPTMHPEVQGIELVWRRDQGCTSRTLPHSIRDSEGFRGSPVEEVFLTRAQVRCRLEAGPPRFPQLALLAAQGLTDYVAEPVEFGEGQLTCVTYATDRPGGFHDAELATLQAILMVLVQRMEVGALRRARQALLEVYLGAEAAERVLSGAFRRGEGSLRTVAILYCDLRGFTALSDALPPADVVAILDRYFELVGGAVDDHGGQILKFIGDAMLATFPVGSGGARGPCTRALAAARQGLAGLEPLNRARAELGHAPLRMGMALHLGEVMFGNIGARDRLDFTIIGRAVNEAARLEALCKELETPLVLSGVFVRAARLDDAVSLGLHPLRGVRTPQEVFTLAPAMPGPK